MLCIVAWEDPEGRIPFSKFVSDFSMSKLIVVKVSRALNLGFTHCLTSPRALGTALVPGRTRQDGLTNSQDAAAEELTVGEVALFFFLPPVM